MTLTIVGISGSVRAKSFNTALLRAAIQLAPSECRIEIASIREFPLYDGDLEEREGIPSPVADLKTKIINANALLLVTPEYNNSLPGVFKNAIDWLSRPPADIPKVFGGRAVGLIGATLGQGGTRLSQAAWLPVLRMLGTRPYFGKSVYISQASQVFSEDGEIKDQKIEQVVRNFMQGFAEFIASSRA